MVTLPIRYPLDPTGVSPDNKIVGEQHTLVNRTVRAVAPGYGSFFAESVVVRDVATGLTLTKGTQYVCTELFEFVTGRYGKEIDGIILIKDSSVGSVIEIDYQTLGGEYSTNSDAIIQMLNSADLDNRPVAWGDIIGKPEAFTPAKHFHDVGDIYGFEYVVHSIERVRSAILIGDDASHDQIYRYIDASFAQVNTHVTTVETNLNAHLADKTNPHQTTKTQVGLGNVDNFLTATTTQAQAGTSTTTFMTPALTAAAITQQVGSGLAAHIANTNNPHQVTATQVGLGNVQNYNLASLADAQAGTSNTAYMTPALTAAAINSQTGAALTAHLDDYTNPHQVTKTQVGLGNVDNFLTATQPDAETGLSVTNKFMTPQRTAQAIAAQIGNSFTTHVNNFSNPHQVTKAQVGLGNVDNFLTASQAQAQAGTDSQTFMTPQRTAQAITVQSGALLNQHIADHSNPHQVTQAQVGLGNVQNYTIATDGQAADSSQNSVYATPHSVWVALYAYSPSKTGAGASGTWNINIGGSSNYANSAGSANSVAWGNVSGRPTNVSAFANDSGYTVPTSAYTWNPQTFNSIGVQVGATSNSGTVFQTSNGSASISFLRPNAYGINFGLDADNWVRLGGWSNGYNVHRMMLDPSGNAYFQGNVQGYSDRRLKKDIELINDPVEKIKQLEGVTYTRTDTGERQTGLIAQDVLKVLPEAVKEMPSGMLSLAYGNLAGLMVESIKELAKQIEELKAEIKTLKG